MNDVAIHTTDLSKSYGDKPALLNLNLTVDAGEIFGLLGHNGAGKTTTVNLLTTLLRPDRRLGVRGFRPAAARHRRTNWISGKLPAVFAIAGTGSVRRTAATPHSRRPPESEPP